MAPGLLVCSAVIVLCILTNRFLKRFGIPAVLIFIALGMLFGSEGLVKIPFDNFGMAENICCTALIFIMFYGGFGTSFKEAKPILPKAVLLSTAGVVITAGLTGLFCHYIVGMSLQEGLLVGAVLSSTDAASVFSILRSKKLNLKEGTASLLEVESGSNDPFAYMLTIIILNWMAGGNENILLLIAEEVGFGLLFGAGLGILAVKILKSHDLDTGGIETILMIAFVLFSYAAPVLIGGNGYLSVYLFGFIVGNAEFKTKISLVHFFDNIDRLAQMLIFFLLGLLVFPSMLLPILGTSVLIFIGLTFIARPVAVFLLLTPFRSSWRQQALTAFSGLRGAASAVFAIIAVVSPGYAQYDVYNIVFCVAIISVAFQGLLLPFVAERLDMVDDSQNVMKTFSDYQDDQEMQLIQIRLNPGHRYIGKYLRDLNLGDVLAVLIERGSETIIPRGDVLLQEGDVLVLSGETYQGEADTLLDEIKIEPGDTRTGSQVKDIKGIENALIVLIRRADGNTVVPKGDTVIQDGDVLVVSRGG
ncbi:K+/H+ antiporter [Lachnoclostridium sp. An169]|uniref:potassium/proton antiporter n=1 Tax=Lachnoclostridium sp. An169 TaxID=1965569 RepID=UPI000B37FF74|nr:potassium/proton antiporter [Lachnoclostridium sp. An169]OUP81724.1 K+/H+ antiporter [Lachnoclostridium sp. An169]HJA66863.1 potassium/proton antiporter [Candidatus Mediterraneibacter cottocaccae]